MSSDPSQSIQFANSSEPPIAAGVYLVTVKQRITDLSDPLNIKVLGTYPSDTPKPTKVYVHGNRLSVDPLDIESVFPPDGATGDYGSVLPHISFSRKALPWEQNSGVDKAPWLALLVFHQADEGGIPRIQPAMLGDLLRNDYQPTDTSTKKVPSTLVTEEGNKTLTIATYNDAVSVSSWKRPSENDWDPCMVVDIPVSLFQKIAPRKQDLPWLAHSRIDSTSSGSSREFSAVIANRLPQREGASMACLVSLEHMAKFLLPAANIKANATHIRLIVLKAWSFTSGADLRGFDRNLKTGPLKVPSPPLAVETPHDILVKNALAMGYTALDHDTRWGDKTISWYRGPFLPFSSEVTLSVPLPPVNEHGYATDTTPLSSADEALRYDPETGMLDVSYAAAWQLGRLIALRDATFSSDLYHWKRQNRQMILQPLAGDMYTMLMHLMSSFSQGTNPVESARDIINDLERMKERLKNAKAPDTVLKRLTELGRLEGVPLDYLVPDERMLPPDSLRFFQVDPNWIYSLIEGAYSIGRISTSDQKQDTATCLHNPYKQISGFLLRSAIVSGWPTLQVQVEVSNSSQIHELRCQRITPDILLYMVEVEGAGVITAVNLHVPAESLEFHLPRRKPAAFLDPGKSVLDIDKLAKGGKTDGNAAQFARELAAGVTPLLAWDNAGDVLSLQVEPADKVETHEWQFLVNGRPFGQPASLAVPASGNASIKVTLPLLDDLPSGEIAVRIRPAASASPSNSGRWATSTSLHRPSAYQVQPQITYRVGQESITASWPLPGPGIHLAAQLISTNPWNHVSSPAGGIIKATSGSTTQLTCALTFSGSLPTGKVHVRFRSTPADEKSLPGEWMMSTKSLISFTAPSNQGLTTYRWGIFTGRFYDDPYNTGVNRENILEMYLTTPERGVTNPVYKASGIGPGADLIVKPEDAPGGNYIRVARVMGKDDRFITSGFGPSSTLLLLGKPKLTLSSPTTVSWNKDEHVRYYNCMVFDRKPPSDDKLPYPRAVHGVLVHSSSADASMDLPPFLPPGTYYVIVQPYGDNSDSCIGPENEPFEVKVPRRPI